MKVLAHRLPAILFISVLVILVLAYSFILLQSTDLALGLLIVGFTILLLLIEPFVGLLVYVLFVFTGPQGYVPALQNLRVMLVIGVATVGSLLGRRMILGAGEPTPGAPQTTFVIWFILAVIVSRVAHLEFLSAGEQAYNLVDVLLLYFLIVKLVTTERRMRQLLAVVFIGIVAMAAQAIAQHVIGGGVFAWQEFEKGRVSGIGQFVNPNMLAIGLVCGVPVAFSLFAGTRNIFFKIITVAGLAAILYALYLTNSRSGVLSLCFVAGAAFSRRFGLLAGVGVLVLSFFLVIQFGPSRMAELSPEEASAHGRMLAWDQGYQIFAENPLTGAGAGAWYEKYRTLVAHNSFIHCAAELGLFGLAAWVMLSFISIKNLWYVARPRKDEPGVASGSANSILLAFLGFLFASLFISKTYHVLYFLLLGLAAAAVNIYVSKSEGDYELLSRRDIVFGLALMVAGLIAFKGFLMVVGVGG